MHIEYTMILKMTNWYVVAVKIKIKITKYKGVPMLLINGTTDYKTGSELTFIW